MPGTLRLTREGVGIELRHRPFDVLLDGRVVAPIERGDTTGAMCVNVAECSLAAAQLLVRGRSLACKCRSNNDNVNDMHPGGWPFPPRVGVRHEGVGGRRRRPLLSPMGRAQTRYSPANQQSSSSDVVTKGQSP